MPAWENTTLFSTPLPAFIRAPLRGKPLCHVYLSAPPSDAEASTTFITAISPRTKFVLFTVTRALIVTVGVGVRVRVAVAVGVCVRVGVGVAVGIGVRVGVGVAVRVGVGVRVGVSVAVRVGVGVRVGVRVGVDARWTVACWL